MSMPRRSRSRMAASVLQAGPMVQMILARRGEGLSVEGSAIDSGLLAVNLSPQTVVAQFDDLYHEGHEVTRRKHLQIKTFVTLRVLRGSWFFSSSVKLIHYSSNGACCGSGSSSQRRRLLPLSCG